jgi:cobalt/nickel transport system permease protein
MHIADGIVPVEICAGAYVVSLGAVYWLGREVETEEVSRMGLMAAAVFVASLVHFPLAGATVHLGLFGLVGVLLGRRGFPVVFASLLFQTLLFQHGGLLSLGLNSFNMGAGALIGWGVWGVRVIPQQPRAFVAGLAGSFIPAVLMAAEFQMSGYGRGFFVIAGVYSIVAVVEGVATAVIVAFFARTKPEILRHATT